MQESADQDVPDDLLQLALQVCNISLLFFNYFIAVYIVRITILENPVKDIIVEVEEVWQVVEGVWQEVEQVGEEGDVKKDLDLVLLVRFVVGVVGKLVTEYVHNRQILKWKMKILIFIFRDFVYLLITLADNYQCRQLSVSINFT